MTGVAVSIVLGIALVWVVGTVVSARFGEPSRDPHGYTLIFGAVLGMVLAVAFAATLPLAFRDRRARVGRLSAAGLLVVVAGLLTLLFTA